MTHDPLCPFFYDHTGRELVRQTGNRCVYCDLISRVRDDERAATLRDAVNAVKAQPDSLHSSAEWDRDYDADPTGQTRNPRIWVREALAAIDALREKK